MSEAVCVTSETVIEAAGLSKVYWDGSRPLEIIKDLSLSIRRGEGVAILGPSGSGKTTLLNLLSGLDTPNQGRVRLAGIDLDRLDETKKADFRNRHIGFVFQFYHLLPELTALENVMLPGLIRRSDSPGAVREKAEALLGRVGLRARARHFPSELSGGEQQRVALARALANDPDILFCDEPTGNLDLAMGQEIAGLLADVFRKEGKTVLIVTHDERIARLADRVWNLVRGDWEN